MATQVTHEVSVNFYQKGEVDVYEAFNNVWQFIHKGSSPQSRKFAANVLRDLDNQGYLVKMVGANSFEFTKTTKRS